MTEHGCRSTRSAVSAGAVGARVWQEPLSRLDNCDTVHRRGHNYKSSDWIIVLGQKNPSYVNRGHGSLKDTTFNASLQRMLMITQLIFIHDYKRRPIIVDMFRRHLTWQKERIQIQIPSDYGPLKCQFLVLSLAPNFRFQSVRSQIIYESIIMMMDS